MLDEELLPECAQLISCSSCNRASESIRCHMPRCWVFFRQHAARLIGFTAGIKESCSTTEIHKAVHDTDWTLWLICQGRNERTGWCNPAVALNGSRSLASIVKHLDYIAGWKEMLPGQHRPSGF